MLLGVDGWWMTNARGSRNRAWGDLEADQVWCNQAKPSCWCWCGLEVRGSGRCGDETLGLADMDMNEGLVSGPVDV